MGRGAVGLFFFSVPTQQASSVSPKHTIYFLVYRQGVRSTNFLFLVALFVHTAVDKWYVLVRGVLMGVGVTSSRSSSAAAAVAAAAEVAAAVAVAVAAAVAVAVVVVAITQ